MDFIENLHFFRMSSMNTLAASTTTMPTAMQETTSPATASLTDEVLQRLEGCTEPRFKEVMESLIVHLHDFVRAVDLRPEEWMQAIEFLTATGKTCTDKRQEFILLSDTLGVSMLVVALAQAR